MHALFIKTKKLKKKTHGAKEASSIAELGIEVIHILERVLVKSSTRDHWVVNNEYIVNMNILLT